MSEIPSLLEPIKELRDKLLAGQFCLGCGVTLCDPVITEVIAPCADFIWIDLEHSHLSVETVMAHLMAARVRQVPVMVRSRDSDIASIKSILDIGAQGIVVPQVQSAAEARKVMEICRYAPLGKRGLGPRRASDFGRTQVADYIEAANKYLFVTVQVETVAAYEEIDDFVSIDGIDSICIGPSDLALSLGHPGQLDHPHVVEAIQTIVNKIRAAGKFCGMGMAGDQKYALEAARKGVHWVQCGEDWECMYSFAANLFSNIRQELAK